jgi:hypothetical protein
MTKEEFYAVIESDLFREKLEEAILIGKGTDWGFDGEDEFEYDSFTERFASDAVIELLKSEFKFKDDTK